MCMVSIRNIPPFRDEHVQKKFLLCFKTLSLKLVLQQYTVHCILVGYKLHAVILDCIVLQLFYMQVSRFYFNTFKQWQNYVHQSSSSKWSFFFQLLTELTPVCYNGLSSFLLKWLLVMEQLAVAKKRGLSSPTSCSLSVHILWWLSPFYCNLAER